MISIVVTTFNRRALVGRALRSALHFIDGQRGKVIVVDDGSTDGTRSFLVNEFAQPISRGQLVYIAQSQNQGVTAAKNSGFEHAEPSWVIFLDSDDELLSGAASDVEQELEQRSNAPIVFFRCVDEKGKLVGRRFSEPQVLFLSRYLAQTSYGEALTAINKSLVRHAPFDSDLRGYEGLGCARLIKKFGPAILSPVVARRYDRTTADRLSAPKAILARARLLSRGHRRFISLFERDLTMAHKVQLWAKAFAYGIAGVFYEKIQSFNA